MSALIERSAGSERASGAAKALLRVSLGVMYLTHSVVLKTVHLRPGRHGRLLRLAGASPASAYLVFAAEAVGGVLLLANVATGWVSLALIPVLGGALWVHAGNGWVFSNAGGGWEYPLFLILVSVVVALQAFAARATATQRTGLESAASHA